MKTNWRRFEGLLAPLEIPSSKAVTGSFGKSVLIRKEVALRACKQMIGLPIHLDLGWEVGWLNQRRSCGVITAAFVVEASLIVRGYIQPDVADAAQRTNEALSLDYELKNVLVADRYAPVWEITGGTFTGATVGLKSKSAYRLTSFRIVPELVTTG